MRSSYSVPAPPVIWAAQLNRLSPSGNAETPELPDIYVQSSGVIKDGVFNLNGTFLSTTW